MILVTKSKAASRNKSPRKFTASKLGGNAFFDEQTPDDWKLFGGGSED